MSFHDTLYTSKAFCQTDYPDFLKDLEQPFHICVLVRLQGQPGERGSWETGVVQDGKALNAGRFMHEEARFYTPAGFISGHGAAVHQHILDGRDQSQIVKQRQWQLKRTQPEESDTCRQTGCGRYPSIHAGSSRTDGACPACQLRHGDRSCDGISGSGLFRVCQLGLQPDKSA